MKRHAKRFLKKMGPPHDRKIFWPAGLLFLVVAALLVLSLEAGGPRFSPASDLPSPIGIEGELSRGGGKWEKLTADTPFDTDERHTIRIRGHFDREIPAGEELLFHVRHLFVSLRINGREVWENYTSPRPSFSASPGISWITCRPGGAPSSTRGCWGRRASCPLPLWR